MGRADAACTQHMSSEYSRSTHEQAIAQAERARSTAAAELQRCQAVHERESSNAIRTAAVRPPRLEHRYECAIARERPP